MASAWIVRLVNDDGTSVEGRLDIVGDHVRFRPGSRGTTLPALLVRRDEIVSVGREDHDVVHRVRIALADGRHLLIDNGLRSTDELAKALTR